MSLARRGSLHPMWGKILSEEHRKKISQNNARYWLGKKRPDVSLKHKGKIVSEQTRIKMSARMKNYDPSLETRKNMSKGQKLRFIMNPMSAETKKKMGIARTGVNNPYWKGGYENKLMLNRNRRILKNKIAGNHTLEQWNELKREYNYMCLCCKKFEPEITLTEDHIVPISKGGVNDIFNIQPLCKGCNSKKNNKIINFINLI